MQERQLAAIVVRPISRTACCGLRCAALWVWLKGSLQFSVAPQSLMLIVPAEAPENLSDMNS